MQLYAGHALLQSSAPVVERVFAMRFKGVLKSLFLTSYPAEDESVLFEIPLPVMSSAKLC